MKIILLIIAGFFSFILGDAISASMRNDESGKQDDSLFTWGLKFIIALVLMSIIYVSC